MMHLRKLSGIFNLIESGQIIRAFIEISINLTWNESNIIK